MPKIDVPEDLAPEIKEMIQEHKDNAEKRNRLKEVETEIDALRQEESKLRADLKLPGRASASGRIITSAPGTRMKKADVEKLEAEIVAFVKDKGPVKRGDIAGALSFPISPASLSQRLDKLSDAGGPLKKDTSGGRVKTTYTVA